MNMWASGGLIGAGRMVDRANASGIGSGHTRRQGPAEQPTRVSEQVTDIDDLTGRRVLIVDDDQDVRLLLRGSLRPLGPELAVAVNGTSALEILDKGGVDLVLLDIQMPDLSGWEVLAEIRRRWGPLGVPVVMCSVKSLIHDQEQALRLGSDGYVAKPFSVDGLCSEVVAAITRPADQRIAYRDTLLRELAEPGETNQR